MTAIIILKHFIKNFLYLVPNFETVFFLLSKLLAFLISPIIWIIVLFFVFVYSKNERRRKKCFLWGFGLLLFFSNSFIFDEFSRAWEIPATQYEDLKIYDVGVVLGGMSVYDEDFERPQFYRGVDRLLQAIELYKLGIIKKIIFTSGSGRILHPEMKEGEYLKRYILYMGVPEKDFLIESESQNTRENALFTKKLIDDNKIKGRFLLITSAFHMRRSLNCFRTVGLEVTPYSTDRYAGPRKFEFDHLFIPNPSAINDWNTLIHEVVGYITYKIIGYG
ncbi:MAG: YdcF family protein [Bacteroidetes bacterium]|nr:YdcF family protein [Bacteroidota bacterium]